MHSLFLFSIAEQFHHWKGTLLVLGVGFLIGTILGLTMKWRSLGLVFSMIMGMVGAWLYHSFLVDYYVYAHKKIWNEVIYSMVGAFVLTVTLNLIFGSNRGKDRTFWRA